MAQQPRTQSIGGNTVTFTKTPPTKPGAYCILAPEGDKFWVELTTQREWKIGGKMFVTPEEIVTNGGEWCGPLIPAEEVEKAYYEGNLHGLRGDILYPDSRAQRIAEGEDV